MTHIIVKDGRVAVSGGRVVTSAGGAPCCCGGGGPDDDIPCPGEAGYCLRVELVGFSAQGCVTEGYAATTIPVTVDELVVDGPLTVTPRPSQSELIRGKGFARYSHLYSDTTGTDTDISAAVFVSCETETGRPYLVNCSASINGGGDTGTRLLGQANLFRAAITASIPGPRIYLDEGPVLIPNVYRDPDVYPDTACSAPGGAPLAATSSGSMRIELIYDEVCDPQSADQLVLVACDGSGDEIIVDPDTNRGEPAASYQGRLWRPARRAAGVPVEVEWVDQECEPADVWPIAQECNGTRSVTFDPATRPADGVTFIVGTVRYRPTNVMSEEAPSSGTWSPDPCTTNPCDDLILNDPRCSLPQYRDCPQCVGFDVGDPQPEPDFDLQDDGTIPGLGDMVAEAIRTISLNTILPCGACERRKQVLNRFGERAGRAVIRLLRW